MKRTTVLTFLVCVALLLVSVFGRADDIHAFDDALVAHWAFNDMAGPLVTDLSSNGFHATHSGATWTSGVTLSNGGLTFDGIDDVMVVPGFGLPPPQAIGELEYGSISLRFRFRATASGDIIPLLYYGEADTGTKHNSLIVEIGHGDNPANRRLYFTIVNVRFCYDSGVQLTPETWIHFVAVVGPDGNTGYLNGQEMTTRHYNLGSNASDTDFFSSVPVHELMTIAYGRYGMRDSFFYGPVTVSDVRIYNRELSADEIRCLYEAVSD